MPPAKWWIALIRSFPMGDLIKYSNSLSSCSCAMFLNNSVAASMVNLSKYLGLKKP